MSAYVLAQIQIDDPDEYQNYLAGYVTGQTKQLYSVG
jgi:uncharacterized protein (DUF1330 family)